MKDLVVLGGVLFTFFGCSSMTGRSPVSQVAGPLQRSYVDGEILKYRIQMVHTLDGVETSSYDAHATGVVKKDERSYHEEFQWTAVIDDGKKANLSSFDEKFRQVLSLAPPFKLSIPTELTQLSRFLIGPVTDLLTFYVDESLAVRQQALRKPGDRVYLRSGVASSWGSGQDCLDFDVQLLALDPVKSVGSIRVSHLPPSNVCIQTPSPWMQAQVTDVPNNWFDIEHLPGKWTASVGKETFDVDQQVDLSTGKILSATMYNPVVFKSRVCRDEKLLKCSKSTSHRILRTLTFTLEK